jgi:hypothetical protein
LKAKLHLIESSVQSNQRKETWINFVNKSVESKPGEGISLFNEKRRKNILGEVMNIDTGGPEYTGFCEDRHGRYDPILNWDCSQYSPFMVNTSLPIVSCILQGGEGVITGSNQF